MVFNVFAFCQVRNPCVVRVKKFKNGTLYYKAVESRTLRWAQGAGSWVGSWGHTVPAYKAMKNDRPRG